MQFPYVNQFFILLAVVKPSGSKLFFYAFKVPSEKSLGQVSLCKIFVLQSFNGIAYFTFSLIFEWLF